MPFKSEKQRKYLWANEPEIARDWTDTYGSEIQAAHGGRIGFYRGSDRHAGTGTTTQSSKTQSGSGRGPHGEGAWSGPTYSSPKTVTVAGPHRGDGIGSQTFDINKRTIDRQNQYRQGAYQRAHPFLSKIRGGLGALGRGIGHVARNFNPFALTFDNPLAKLLMSGYGRGNIKDIFQKNTQGDEEIDYNQLGLYTDRIDDAIGPGKRVGEDINVQETILPEDRPTDSLMDDTTLMADVSQGDLDRAKSFKGFNQYDLGTLKDLGIVNPTLTEEELKGINEGTITKPTGKFAAEGGRIGYQMGNMVGAEMEGAEMQSQEVIRELYQALIAQGLSPQQAMEKIKEIIASSQTQEPEAPMMGEEFPGQEFGRAPAAFGGIMDTYTGRRKYGLGSFIKKAVGKVKKIAKSPIGKAALAAGLIYLTKGQAAKGAGGWKKYLLGAPGSIATSGGVGGLTGAGPSAWTGKALTPGILGAGGPMGKFALTKGAGSMMPTWLGVGAAATAAPLIMGATGNWEQDQLPNMPGGDQAFDFNYGQMRKDIAGAVQGGDYNKFTEVLDNYGLTEGNQIPYWGSLAHGAEGGRVGRQEGGLMDLGGMEKDYRNDGGFVPIGGQEKADDVPARLSRNEFVFTADAVRNAGGGDIDKGAEVMENVMKNLEGGGQISEESQGQGAQEMFETSERLSEVI